MYGDGLSYSVKTLARLDRLSVNLNPIDRLDLHPSVGTTESALVRSHLSDHTPVRGVLNCSTYCPSSSKIPSWVTRHECYSEWVDMYLQDVSTKDCPFQNLLEAKEAMHAAAQAVKRKVAEDGPTTTQQKVIIALRIWRAERSGD